MRWTSLLAVLLATGALAQSPPQQDPPHDITQVDVAPINGAISVPLPEKQRKRLQKYEIPELVGSRQALGSQLIDGRLRHPMLDYITEQGPIHQRLSVFEGGWSAATCTAPAARSARSRSSPTTPRKITSG